MNDYKVPQDVEAEDKLLGPFSFRQFIYLIIVALAGLGAFALFQLFPPLVIIPVPIILFFGALALPIRKDQPMEIYLAAVLSFYLKPRKRLWQPDGVEHLIEITAPKVAEPTRTKGLSQDEAVRRLSYLSDVVDTGGWAIKNAVSQNSSIHDDFVHEAQTAEDIFEDNRVANNIDNMIELNDRRRKKQILQNMDTAKSLADYTSNTSDEIQDKAYKPQDPRDYYQQAMKAAQALPSNELLNQPSDIGEDIHLDYNPYPDSIRQSVIQPILSKNQPSQTDMKTASRASNQNQTPAPQNLNQPTVEAKTTSINRPNDDIMRLVSEGKDLSVETLARQANKLHDKEVNAKKQSEGDLDEEVVISLR